MRLLIWAFLLSVTTHAFSQSYRVGPGDVLSITVWEVEDWQGDYRVDAVGNLQLPLLGEVAVKDLTLIEVRDLIRQGLKEGGFVQNPQVFVDIKEVVYKPIRVIGAVKNPGKIVTFSQDLYLLDALAEVGGLLSSADDTVVVMRQGQNPFKASYRELIMEGKKNIPILPGDTVMVPTAQPIEISVLGEVNRQGQIIFSGGMEVTILRVLAAAGGFTDYARENRVTVRRRGQDDIEVDVRSIRKGDTDDIPLKHDDVVIVGSRF